MKTLTVGIGCVKSASVEQVEAALRIALAGRSLDEVREVATIDTKAEEAGLTDFCARYGLPLRIFTREQIAAAGHVPTPSATVRALAGVDGVCEPCALLAAPDGKLIAPKTVVDGVTVAIVSTTESQQQDTP